MLSSSPESRTSRSQTEYTRKTKHYPKVVLCSLFINVKICKLVFADIQAVGSLYLLPNATHCKSFIHYALCVFGTLPFLSFFLIHNFVFFNLIVQRYNFFLTYASQTAFFESTPLSNIKGRIPGIPVSRNEYPIQQRRDARTACCCLTHIKKERATDLSPPLRTMFTDFIFCDCKTPCLCQPQI